MKIACLATKLFEDHELADPVKALRDEGHEVEIIAPKRDEIAGYHGEVRLRPDRTIGEVHPDDYDALFVPGGFSPDQLRADERFVEFTRAFRSKPVFAICHGPQLLFTAGLLIGRRTTAWKTVQFDLRRAGIDVVNEEVVRDGDLITSRQPSDLPAFSRAIVEALKTAPARLQAQTAGIRPEGAKAH
jgi:protease I